MLRTVCGHFIFKRALVLVVPVLTGLIAGMAAFAIEPPGRYAAGDNDERPPVVVPKKPAWQQRIRKESPLRLTQATAAPVPAPAAPAANQPAPQLGPLRAVGPFRDNITSTNQADAVKMPTFNTTLYFYVTLPSVNGQLTAELDDGSPVPVAIASPTDNPVWVTLDVSSIANQRPAKLTLKWTQNPPAAGATVPAPNPAPSVFGPISLDIDTRGPLLLTVDLVDYGTGLPALLVKFQEGDLNPSFIDPSGFQISATPSGTVVTGITAASLQDDGKSVRLQLPALNTGTYQVKVLAPATGVTYIRDKAGNAAGVNPPDATKPQIGQFNSFPDSVTGPHREFPPFLPPTNHDPDIPFNPGAHVETRVAHLYYMRDAHRMAQIINRNVKSYNKAAVTKAQREAEDMRDIAAQATDDRQAKERAAIRAAQATRDAESQLAAARESLEQARAVSAFRTQQLAATKSELADQTPTPQGATPSPKVTQLQSDQTQQQARLETAQAAVNENLQKIAGLETKVAGLRELERNAAEDSATAQAKETRAREKQFRAETAAASTDPDTYAPATLYSPDPVSQVSISVIGEGVIQLRGPIAGINEIRMMINRMDAPLGQVKVGIHTVQINGEHEDRMEKVAGRIEGYIDVSRFMTAQSLMLLRRAIQETASQIAEMAEAQGPGHRQLDRDRKYLYAFFGRDFIDELYAMDSEFLKSGNKLLSLHSMDTISLSKALFIMALAKNSVRQMVLQRFLDLVVTELPQAEYDFRRANNMLKGKDSKMKEICKRACEQYRFRSMRGYFDAWIGGADTMTPMQREFIRLAQIFKSQMVAEVELKQRVIERGLIQDNANDEKQRAALSRAAHEKALTLEKDAQLAALNAAREAEIAQRQFRALTVWFNELDDIQERTKKMKSALNVAGKELSQLVRDSNDTKSVSKRINVVGHPIILSFDPSSKFQYYARGLDELLSSEIDQLDKLVENIRRNYILTSAETTLVGNASERIAEARTFLGLGVAPAIFSVAAAAELLDTFRQDHMANAREIAEISDFIDGLPSRTSSDWNRRAAAYKQLLALIKLDLKGDILNAANQVFNVTQSAATAQKQLEDAKYQSAGTRSSLDHRKLLDFLIDEQTEKYIDLVEASRSHIAAFDNHIKRLITALEDDFKVQFYDPAFVKVRTASCEWDVTFGQIERTTILTNNRALGKVAPQATMEFDLPKRDLMIVEAMNGAKALTTEYGNLLQDPTFLGLTSMLSGSPATRGTSSGNAISGLPGQGLATPAVRNVLPSLSTSNQEQLLAESGGPDRKFGTALDKLIPDPAIFKVESGTGFEIKPVIQPDGDAVVYDFNYLYRTNVREPVRADEKHLGRVKEHYINTQVQTSTFELREISRYMVALKVSRTSRGVPLLEDMPGLGILFRPLPNAESSLQQNIVLGHSVVYPTLFDLMGLRWAPAAVDLDHISLRDSEHVIRGRQKTIKDFTFDESSKRVDGFLEIERKRKVNHRPDLYHRQSLPSPYHPGGYVVPDPPEDPTRNRFEIPDIRPEEYREPFFDELHRNEIRSDAAVPGDIVRPPSPVDRSVPPGIPALPGSQSSRERRSHRGMAMRTDAPVVASEDSKNVTPTIRAQDSDVAPTRYLEPLARTPAIQRISDKTAIHLPADVGKSSTRRSVANDEESASNSPQQRPQKPSFLSKILPKRKPSGNKQP